MRPHDGWCYCHEQLQPELEITNGEDAEAEARVDSGLTVGL